MTEIALKMADEFTMRLPERQQAVYSYLRLQISQGCIPSLREIAKAIGINSTSGVERHLRALEKKGLIKRRRHLARSIRIIQPESNEAKR